jgi:hypothetical protein
VGVSNFEEAAQRFAGVAAAVAVGAEGGERYPREIWSGTSFM